MLYVAAHYTDWAVESVSSLFRECNIAAEALDAKCHSAPAASQAALRRAHLKASRGYSDQYTYNP